MDMPTHQMIQTKVGLKLRIELESPPNPAATTRPNRNTDRSLTGRSVTEDVRAIRDQRVPIRLSRQYPASPLTLTNTLMKTKESATANPAPMRKNPRGTGSSVRSPKPWA